MPLFRFGARFGASRCIGLVVLVASGCALSSNERQDEAPSVAPVTPATANPLQPLRPRVAADKPATTVQGARFAAERVVVKLKEGSGVRLREGALVAAAARPSDAPRLARASLTPSKVTRDLASANGLLGARSIARYLDRAEDALDRERAEGEARAGEELADLNLYYEVRVRDAAEQKAVLDGLNALDSVEIAYAPAIPVNPAIDIPPTTRRMTGDQLYVEPEDFATRNGINARHARTVEGGAGAGVRVIDIESGWNLTHEDLPSVFAKDGFASTDPVDVNHGTAVLGIIAGVDNAYGVTGLASDARVGCSSPLASADTSTWNIARAINAAASRLTVGDILLLEAQLQGPASGTTCPCGGDCTQFEDVPVEIEPAFFDAIRNATALGLTVVEAAGNGSMNLDSSLYEGKFDRTHRDSGAILVGAGSSSARRPLCFTNFGSRVDVQGWGEWIATLGYGDTQINGDDQNQWYIPFFGGTSGASPMIVGAAADIQGARYAHGLGPLLPDAMRALLRDTGTPQANDARKIGPLPDLQAALTHQALHPTQRFTQVAAGGTTASFIDQFGINGDPNAVLHIAHVRAEGGAYDDHALAVTYDGAAGRWAIIHEDGTPLPAGAVYSVVANGGYVHRATSSTMSFNGYMTYVNNVLANDKPDAILQVTQNRGASAVVNDHPISVRYDIVARRWAIYNEDKTPIPAGAAFNVQVSPFGSFVHSATSPSGNSSRIDLPALDGNRGAHLLVTHNFHPNKIYDTKNVGLGFLGSHWFVFDENFVTIGKDTGFNITLSEPRPTW